MTIIKTLCDLLGQLGATPKAGIPMPMTPDVSFAVKEPPKGLVCPKFADRLEEAKSGSAFAASILSMGPDKIREAAIVAEIKAGNIPDFMRHFVEMQITVGANTIVYLVSPDYLSIGENADFIRMPIDPITAQKIAKDHGCTLPTRKMVNQIWKAATVKIEPQPNGAPYDLSMQNVPAFIKNNNKIEAVRAGQALGKLVAGHKKDVIISETLLTFTNNVAIYGWFYANGKVIQNLNPKDHDDSYKDYSHGIRLVSRNVLVNGVHYDLFDILKDPTLCNLISDEGNYDASNLYGN